MLLKLLTGTMGDALIHQPKRNKKHLEMKKLTQLDQTSNSHKMKNPKEPSGGSNSS